MYVDYAAAIRVMVLLLPGAGLLWLAQFIGRRVNGRLGRAVAVWPFLGLGYLFCGAAALQMLWNFVGPPILAVWAWLRQADRNVVDGAPKSAAYVAAQIYEIWVKDETKAFIEKFFERFIPLDKRAPFTFKIRLYCEASTLRVLLTEAQRRDARYESLV